MVIFCLLLALFSQASAQTESGQISGRVLDLQGIPVAAAHVKLVNSARSLVLEAISDPQGTFLLKRIDAGEYQLRGESVSFVSVIVSVSLAAAQRKEIDIRFQQLAEILRKPELDLVLQKIAT
jgi:hypothetical protein